MNVVTHVIFDFEGTRIVASQLSQLHVKIIKA